ncbi:hypothetical protein SAMN05443637_1441 [Pseudonocardia thermophila]|uniref:Uncharacterized protein n=1 Tax=Pseudonocardia thermophila TaxID=1848 RepID=A0A1M7BIW8_PSETH|nr:hypothetical protein SAMN05443637_1441 [Pseudonocardia thermophila]
MTRGPYCTGALTPAGAAPQMVTPHPQRRAMSWCSVTRTVSGGRSNTCRRSTPTSGASARSLPHPAHGPGSCRTRSSGSATSARVDPGCPGCPPGCRPLRRRNERGADLANGESDDGGFEEFREFCPNRRVNSAFSARNAVTSARNCSISAV